MSTRADALTPGSSPGISHASLSEASQHLQGPARDLAEEVARARTDPRRAFGHFLILSELGKGGMGVVFRAWDDRLKRLTALKTLGSAGDAQAIKRFQREAEAVARLRHPGIVSVFEAGELGGQQFLAMEFIEGRTLEQRLQGVRVEGSTHPDDGEGSRSRKTRIALHKALEAVRDAARAVHYAHEQGVIHRDLKPQNIMLDRADRAHVLDFGLALVNDSQDARITKAGTRIGTLAYMSPEQATGQPLDARSDVWSLGATLYTVLTNRCPFEAESELALLAALTSVDPSPPSAHNPRARGDLDVICLRCLEKEREKRYPSAAALADDLDRHLAGEPIEARELGGLEKGRRWVKRNRLLAAGLVAFSLVVSGAAAFIIIDRTSRRRAEREAARDEAERTWAELARGDASIDEAVARSFDAFQAASRRLALDPEDVEARAAAFRAACALGDAATAGEQWSFAAHAYRLAQKLEVDDALAQGKLDATQARRTHVEKEHEKTVRETLALARAGALDGKASGFEDAVFALVSLREPATVALLVAALDDVASRLPVVENGDASVAKLACDALGRIGIPKGVVPALGRYLEKEKDELRAARAAQALCRIGGKEAEKIVLAARDRFGEQSTFWGQVQPVLRLTGVETGLSAETARGYAERGLVRLEKGDLDGAIADCTRAIELEPGFPGAWGNRGNAKQKKGDVAGAFADYSRLLEVDPKNAQGWKNRGGIRLQMNDMDGAIADETRSLELDPDNPSTWNARGDAKRFKGDQDGAIADYSRAIELSPIMAGAWCNRSWARGNKGDLEGALADASHAIELDARSPIAWNTRGEAKRLKGDLDGAIADLSRALELEPLNATAWGNRGIVRQAKGDLDGALADCNKAIELHPNDRLIAAAWFTRGLIHCARGNAERALADATRATELDPRALRAWVLRGDMRRAAKDWKGSIADYTKALELSPKEKLVYATRADSRRNAGDLDGALADYSQAIEIDPNLASAWSDRGIVRWLKGDIARATADCSHALELDPRMASAWCNRGMTRHNVDRDGAIADYTRALEIDPRCATALIDRGDALREKGDLDGSIADCTRAIEIDAASGLAWGNRSLAREAKGEVDGAISDATRAIELAPTASFDAWLARGLARKKKNEARGAREDLEHFIEIAPPADPRIARARQALDELKRSP